MKKKENRRLNRCIGVIFSILTLWLLLIGTAYKVVIVGAVLSAFTAYTAFQGDKVKSKFAKLGAKIRKNAKR